MALNIKEYCYFVFQSVIGKTLNISTSTNKRTSMVIQTKQVFKYVLHWNIIIVFFTFQWIRAMCLHQVEKYVTGPWISWNLVYIFLTYTESLYVEMVSWQRRQWVKISIPNLTEYKIYSWKLGYHLIKWLPTYYPNTYKAIYSINELICDIVI